jgi:small-conductance mechanosensitive channel
MRLRGRSTKGRSRDALARAREHDWQIALPTGAIALVSLIVGSAFGNVHGPLVRPRVVVWSAAAVLLVFGVIATRRVAAALGQLVSTRDMAAAGAAVHLIVSGVGYVVIIFAELGLLDVSIDHLLIGAGLAGIVLGIAAQQSLGNVFASLVLLLAHPFTVGERVRIRSSTLGGVVDASVLGISLTYVTIQTDEGVLKVPNSVMLAAAIGPIGPKQEDVQASTPPTRQDG